MADLSASTAALAALSASADRVIALNASNASGLATAQAELADTDAKYAAEMASITSRLDAVAPPQAQAPTPVPDNTLTLDTPAPAGQ